MRLRKQPSLANRTYGQVLKSAIRRSGLFLKRSKLQQLLIVLKLPFAADEKAYLEAARVLVKDVAELASFHVHAPASRRLSVVGVDAIEADIEAGNPIIVLWPYDIQVAATLFAAADRIVDVGPVRPAHLAASFRQVRGESMTTAEAACLLQYPLKHVFVSLRAGRPIPVAIEGLRLAAGEPVRQAPKPGLLDLEGFGTARKWGLALASDIAEWRRGKIGWSDVDKGILISGPPGCGKTLFASALARTCEIEIVATSVGQWLSAGHLDKVLAAMRKSFQQAVSRKPCVLFLDELDGIGDRSTLTGDHVEYWMQVVNSLLELIDGFERLEGVVLVGATNFPEKIDAALRRAGRLDRHVAIPLPDAQTRRSLCRRYIRSDFTDAEFDGIVASTKGLTGADFEQMGRDVRRCARREGTSISADMVMRLLPPSLKITGERRRTVAVHEAGHAVVGIHLDVGELKEIVVLDEVRQSGTAAGFTHFALEDMERDRQALLSQIAMLMGGRLAEEVILGSAFEGAGGEGSDLQKATDLATLMEVRFGMGEVLGYFSARSSSELEGIRRQVPSVRERVEKTLLKEWKRARAIVEKHEDIIGLLASRLEAVGRVDGREVESMLRGEGQK
ncbi:DNA polymerase III delta prime subunit [Rhizobium sp. BK650]|uniref:AAA family ATPase n=1 Tax=Rhizobium sp. BK650 TaxID=2586990 RepID=UPI0016184E8A|nr:AAA family ATPase [Rhizobium sp. BK650]MBB3658411.1 DNA polymerase III delta prime subunit [Rhizobium sp. BK650]